MKKEDHILTKQLISDLRADYLKEISRLTGRLEDIERIESEIEQRDKEMNYRMTRSEVAEVVGVTRRHVSNWDLEFDESGLTTKYHLRKWMEQNKPARLSRLDGVWLKNMTLNELNP